ncbi:ArsR family transcriptional regulator [Mucilaginibacter yixingensis]|uniref:ArsR family transcriptional regulator n=1 Tax=Mucilaginibacter yixingensis TaxID=1295612 RepID=A0A2T5JG27_9SPHI|nr:metalloregulator ArsR/SmtB family transcription factor [Mucilaginibacter yixingensis]PTR01383.1 ArsR family transcriptional regulator [Mucilaginibacter yixingensis]
MATPELDVFQVIADPSRRQMLKMLSEQSLPINALAGHFEMSRPAVSKHVKILQNAGFISITDSGRERYCMLKQDGFKALQQWLEYYDNFWHNKLRNLETLMDLKEKKK